MHWDLIATTAFGLEAVVVRELKQLGYEARVARPGRVVFVGDATTVARANLWLRTADRVLVQLASFQAPDFDVLFETVRGLPWEEWIDTEAGIPVRGRSRGSQLTSVPACQRTVKKAIVERLTSQAAGAELPETGPPVPVEISLVDNEATIDMDTSGAGLHKRGYRTLAAPAQLRETLAAALVQLSFWKPERPLVDPFCGTGTIAIEAALWGRQIAVGRHREFAAEHWAIIPAEVWRQAREEADDLAQLSLPERIVATDADGTALKLARHHAALAGVTDDIHFQERQFAELRSRHLYGCLVTNPPYGLRMGDTDEITALYRSIPEVLRQLPTWSHFILSARDDFEALVGQSADRRRKLYNGRIACTLYQFYGPRPPRDPQIAPPTAPDDTTVESQSTQPAQAFGGLQQEAARQADEFANRLRKRARHLRRWPTRRGITCFRLYERDIPEIPLVVDRYEQALHIAEFERPHERTAAEHADWLDHMVGAAGAALDIPRDDIFVKHRARQRGHTQYQRRDADEAIRIVQEGGLQLQVDLASYLDTGLFLDHRITRSLVRDAAQGTRFLNLFCYTGTFTAYAAAGEAAQTTSVDLSPTYLEWAQQNLHLNRLAGPAHRFVESDARSYLDSLRDSSQFDLVVIDPPTFSNSKRLALDWDIQRDHAELLETVITHVAPGGSIFFSTNSRRFKLDETSLSGVNVHEISRQTIPDDFRNRRIHRCWKMIKA